MDRRDRKWEHKEKCRQDGHNSNQVSQILSKPALTTVSLQIVFEVLPSSREEADPSSDHASLENAIEDVSENAPLSQEAPIESIPQVSQLAFKTYPKSCLRSPHKSHEARMIYKLNSMNRNLQNAVVDELASAAWHEQEAARQVSEGLKFEKRRQRRDHDYVEPKLPDSLKIAEISAIAFHLNLKKPDVELFSVSLHDIDRELEDRLSGLDGGETEELKEKLPL